jgi:hypothetical protein
LIFCCSWFLPSFSYDILPAGRVAYEYIKWIHIYSSHNYTTLHIPKEQVDNDTHKITFAPTGINCFHNYKAIQL